MVILIGDTACSSDCISLKISDVEHFSCVYLPSICLLRRMSVSAYFLIGLFAFLILSCMSCLYIIWKFFVSCFICNYFLPFWGLSFNLVYYFLCCEKAFKFSYEQYFWWDVFLLYRHPYYELNISLISIFSYLIPVYKNNYGFFVFILYIGSLPNSLTKL